MRWSALPVAQTSGQEKKHRRRSVQNADPALLAGQARDQRWRFQTNARSDIRRADHPLSFQQLLNAFDDVVGPGALRFVQRIEQLCGKTKSTPYAS